MTPPSPTPPRSAVLCDTPCVELDDEVNALEMPNIGDNFVVTAKLGYGGSAVVWRARDRSMLRRQVAIKVLTSSDPNQKRRFQQEAEVLANINHPNVARVFSSGVSADGRPYVVLELFEGLTNARLSGGRLPWRDALEIGIQIASALDALHSKGVIHRDVKPSNIMITKDDAGNIVPKLIDFGIARLKDNYVDPSTRGFTRIGPRLLTQEGVALGTPGYMPLEAGLGAPDNSYDVYSLAVTVYVMCTGEMPGIVPLVPFREMYPPVDAPDDLTTVLAAALAIEPQDRTQTAKEFGRALAAIYTAHPAEKTSILFDGRYERIALLGTGAKSEVVLANHRGTGQDVALKILRSSEADDVSRFRREGSLLRFLEHPGIPRFFDLALNNDPPYIAMARSPGVPAVKFCGVTGRLSAAEVLQVGWQLADVLTYIHNLGIIHRDIHTNNVLLDVQRESRINNARVSVPRTIVVSLVDFGCADLSAGFLSVDSRRYRTPPELRIRIPDGPIHTLPWAAPEARAGRGFTDKSDVYSLGLLLFRLLIGKMPKDRMNPERPSAYVACPNDLDIAILQALNPDPNERPSAQTLAATFEDAFATDELLEAECEAELRWDEGESPDGPLAVILPFKAKRRAMPQVSPRMLQPVIGEAPADDSSAPVDAPTTPVATASPVTAPLPESKPAKSGDRLRHAGAAVVVALLVLSAWLGGRMTARPSVAPVSLTAVTPPVTPPPAAPPSTAAAMAPLPGAGALPSMREALEAVKDGLAACSKKAGGHLLIEFTIAEGHDALTAVKLPTQRDAAILDCVRDATSGLRFKPQGDLTFTKGY